MASKIVEEIGKMSLMEVLDLVKEMEEIFGVSAASFAAAPAAAPVVAEAAEVQAEKAEFKVTLKESGTEKLKAIKALRSVISTLTLKDAKDLVEGAPVVIAESSPKEDAQKIKKALEEAGAKVELS